MQQQKLAKFLRTKRQEVGLSQRDVASKLGYTTAQFISNWERGISSPPIPTIKILAQLYKIEADMLFNLLLETTLTQVTTSMKRQYYIKRSS